jgi:hypothetical protein
MIVLDEQLQGLGLEEAITRWYRGAVFVVKKLRPGRVIKDEAIPTLLRQLKQPTFITIDYMDFWRSVPADNSYCLVCLALSIEQVEEIPVRLRQLLRLPEFKTKKARMGKVILVRERRLQYYSPHEKLVHILRWSPGRV